MVDETKTCPKCGGEMVKMHGFFNDSEEVGLWHGDFWQCECGYQRRRLFGDEPVIDELLFIRSLCGRGAGIE